MTHTHALTHTHPHTHTYLSLSIEFVFEECFPEEPNNIYEPEERQEGKTTNEVDTRQANLLFVGCATQIHNLKTQVFVLLVVCSLIYLQMGRSKRKTCLS